ncbi:MAG: tetratricopeptide repeat protein [Arenicellales bacterium]
MSVIYKALSTIEAAERVKHAYPSGAEMAAVRQRESRRRFPLVPVVAVVSAACAVAVVVTASPSLVPQIEAIVGHVGLAVSGGSSASSTMPSGQTTARDSSAAPVVKASSSGDAEVATGARQLSSHRVVPKDTAPARGAGSAVAAVSKTPTVKTVTPTAAPQTRTVEASGASVQSRPTAAKATQPMSHATVKTAARSASGADIAATAKPSHANSAHPVSGGSAAGGAAATGGTKLASTGSRDYVFQPAHSMGQGARAVTHPSTAEAYAMRSGGAPDGQAQGTGQGRPQGATGGGQEVSVVRDGASGAGQRDGVNLVSVTANNTQRIRLLNSDLSQAIERHDKDAVSRILSQMQELVGKDSTYMLKVRAFTQLSLGGNSEQAMGLLRQVLARNPDDRDAAFNMAIAEINLGRVAAARDRLEVLAASHPGDRQVGELLRSIE